MAIHQKTIEGRDILITVEQVFEQQGKHDYRPLGFVARVSSKYEDDAGGFIPYQGEFVKDDHEHTVVYHTEDEACEAAVAYATKRLKRT